MNSPELPFIPMGGNSEQTALHNRSAAIKRIKHLTGVDLTPKSVGYLKALDLEMWVRFYKDEPPDKKIDEEFCQRAAIVIKDMENNHKEVNHKEYDQAKTEHQIKLEGYKNASKQSESNTEDVGKTDEQGKD